MVCKSTNYASQWLLIFYIASLSLNHSSQLSRHQFVKEIEVLLDQTSWTIFSVPQSFSKSTSWLHLITASKLLELERCGCTHIEDLEKYYANHKKSRTFDCRFWQFYLIENLKTTWDLERDFQGASFEPNRIFLALFVWEILKDKVKKCKFGFRKKIHFHLFSLLIVKKTFVFVHA